MTHRQEKIHPPTMYIPLKDKAGIYRLMRAGFVHRSKLWKIPPWSRIQIIFRHKKHVVVVRGNLDEIGFENEEPLNLLFEENHEHVILHRDNYGTLDRENGWLVRLSS